MALNPLQRKAIKDYYLEGKSQREIANLVGVTLKTVNRRIAKIQIEQSNKQKEIDIEYNNNIKPYKKQLEESTKTIKDFKEVFNNAFNDAMVHFAEEATKIKAQDYGRELIYFITEMAKLGTSNRNKK